MRVLRHEAENYYNSLLEETEDPEKERIIEKVKKSIVDVDGGKIGYSIDESDPDVQAMNDMIHTASMVITIRKSSQGLPPRDEAVS